VIGTVINKKIKILFIYHSLLRFSKKHASSCFFFVYVFVFFASLLMLTI
jgi:hypothetical protein